MNTLIIKNVDVELLKKQMVVMLDLAFRERNKAIEKGQPKREVNARNLEALMDMLSDAEIHEE
jgi:hypothetical protein